MCKGVAMDWIYNNWEKAVPMLISSVSTLISAIAVTVAIYNSIKTQKQYRAGKKPQLSMRLDNFNSILYLSIENTGTVAAKEISISVKSIENNGHNNALQPDGFFNSRFELYPKETSQGQCAYYGGALDTPDIFPTLHIDVAYKVDGASKAVRFSRSVTLSKHWDTKVLADVSMDLGKVEDSLDATARATLRTANYLDGTQLFVFDKINKVSSRNFHNDICHAIKTQDEIDIFAFAKEHETQHNGEDETE